MSPKLEANLRGAAGGLLGVVAIALFILIYVLANEGCVHSVGVRPECTNRLLWQGLIYCAVWSICGAPLLRRVPEQWQGPAAAAIFLPWAVLLYGFMAYLFNEHLVGTIAFYAFAVCVGVLLLFTKVGRFLVIVVLLLWIAASVRGY